MSLKVQGNSSGNVAEVNSSHELLVALPKVLTDTGYAVMVGEVNDGTNGFNGGLATRRAAQVSVDSRLKVGVDQIQWGELFNTTILDTGSFSVNTTTFTTAVTGGYLNLNSSLSTTLSGVSRVQTYRTIPLSGGGSTQIAFRFKMSAATQSGVQAELGLGYATTTTTPTDGVYFKLTTAGVFEGVVNFNGTEYAVPLQTTTSLNAGQLYVASITWDQQRVEFYINGLLEGVYVVPTTAPSSTMTRALPVLMRMANITAPTTAQQMLIAEFVAFTHDLDNNRMWSNVQVGMCKSSYNAPRGSTSASAANNANSTAPTSATLSNTAAGYTTLGGQFQFAAVAGAETDYALFGFQVPVAAVGAGNNNLVITGVHLETFNMGAVVATTPTLLQWSLGLGSTAVSLATADSNTAGTRAPRRVNLGTQQLPVGAVVGANATGIDMQFNTPLYVEAGTFLHVILKMPVGTATASQIVRGTITIEGYYE